ncbi:ABC transporter permease [candidate division KSB1 bacterium]
MKKNNINSAPPKFAQILLKKLFPEEWCITMEGDLEEVFSDIAAQRGNFKAKSWYWRQVIKSIVHYLLNILYWSFTMFKSYMKFAFRSMKRQKSFSLINIAGLAVGMACAIIIMIWIRFELSYDNYHENADRLYRVVRTSETEPGKWNSYAIPGPISAYLREEYPEITSAATFVNFGKQKLFWGGKTHYKTVFFAEQEFLDMFTFEFINGDKNTALVNPASAVITQSVANEFFGDEEPVGKVINGLRVTGVIKNIPLNSHFKFDILAPYRIAPGGARMWQNNWPNSYVLLSKESSLDHINKIIAGAIQKNDPNSKQNIYLQPLLKSHINFLEERMKGRNLATYLYIFTIMAAVVLLIACINFMNLSTARATVRFKEVGIKKVVGSSRMQLAKQFLGESILLSFIALLLSVILVKLALPLINNMLGYNLELSFSGDIILALTGITLLTGLVSGSYPAIYLSAFNPVSLLRKELSLIPFFRNRFGKKLSPGSGVSGFRNILVFIQFTLSILFIVCSSIIYNQLNFLKNKDLGFDKEYVVTIPANGWRGNQFETVKTEFSKNTNILNVTYSQYSILKWSSSGGVDWPGKENSGNSVFDLGRNMVDYDYLETFGLEMVRGRFFSRDFPTDATEACVINEAAVKAMEMEDPVGQRITMFPGTSFELKRNIIGVIKDYHTESLHREIAPFALFLQNTGAYMYARIRPENMQGTLEFMKNAIKKVIPFDPFAYSFIDEDLNILYRAEQTAGKIILYITSLAIFLSCLGLLGLAVFSVEQRTKEIGIRKVLGASGSAIIKMLSKDFVKLVILANIIAWPIAFYYMQKWLQNFAYHTKMNILMFIAAGFTVLVIALLTTILMAIKAARTNPVDTLRYE